MIQLRSVRDVTRLVQMEVSFRWSITDIAIKADVCRDTVKRLAEGKTKSPHFRTVIKILKAMGYKVRVGGDRGTRMPSAISKSVARS